jgi:hypothetical protein
MHVCTYVCTRTTAHVIILEFYTPCLCCAQHHIAAWQNKHCTIMRDFRLSQRRTTGLRSAGLLCDAGLLPNSAAQQRSRAKTSLQSQTVVDLLSDATHLRTSTLDTGPDLKEAKYFSDLLLSCYSWLIISVSKSVW